MKRCVVFLLAGILFLFSRAFAASIGNPIKPLGHLKLAVTGEGNFLLGRDIETGAATTAGGTINSTEIVKATQGYTKLTLGISDYVNIYAKLGSAKINQIKMKFNNAQEITLQSDNNFFYGLGLNGIYKVSNYDFDFGNLRDLGKEFFYFAGIAADITYFEADADELYVDGTCAMNTSGKIKDLEYQLGIFAGIEYPIDANCSLSPYMTVFVNNLNIKTDGVRYNTNVLNFDSDAEDLIGLGFGIDINLSSNVSFNFEGRLLAGNSISSGLTLKF